MQLCDSNNEMSNDKFPSPEHEHEERKVNSSEERKMIKSFNESNN